MANRRTSWCSHGRAIGFADGRPGVALFSELPPLSLYVHLPWCTSKCPYCDFNSHPLRARLPERDYIAALLIDLEQHLHEIEGRTLCSIFLGGGTPSLFSVAGIASLIAGISARLPLEPDAEITLEANPESAEADAFLGYRRAGVNRLSLGVQSFQTAFLRRLGRAHDDEQALAAVAAANATGFDSVNVDMMFGLPAQTLDDAGRDVEAAIAARPPHLSYYQLTLEANTPFHRNPPPLPDEDELCRMQRLIQAVLRSAGYARYEVSAYARAARRCRHNLNYWRFGDYLGIGAGAHSKITHPHRVVRSWKTRHPKEYMRNASSDARVAGVRELTAEDRAFEFLMNALRLRHGFSTTLFERRTGLCPHRLLQQCETLTRMGLMSIDGTRVRATARGYRHLDGLLLRMLPEPAPGHRRKRRTNLE